MYYQHTFIVQAPLEKVADFHRRSASMAAITPPPVVVRLHRAPEQLEEGDEMHFTLWLGPLPLHWQARIKNVSPSGFTDQQLAGPFERWEHRHQFQPVDADRTLVIDQIQASPKKHWFWRWVGSLMWVNLPILFAFRGWKTRRLVEA